MTIIPTVRCRRMETSIHFYTRVLDFEIAEPPPDLGDPGFVALRREGSLLFLSSHAGDGLPGQAVAVVVPDLQAVVRKLRARGLRTPGNPEAPTEVHEGPVRQTWGTTEFYVNDPDGNTLRFIEGLELRGAGSGA